MPAHPRRSGPRAARRRRSRAPTSSSRAIASPPSARRSPRPPDARGDRRDRAHRAARPRQRPHARGAAISPRGRAGNWTLEDLLTTRPANYAFRTPEDDYLSAAIGAIEMLKTGCTSAYDLYMAAARRHRRGLRGGRARLHGRRACAWSWRPPWPTSSSTRRCPDCSTCCPRTCAGPSRTCSRRRPRGCCDLTERAIRRWHGAAGGPRPRRRRADHSQPGHRRVPGRAARGSRASTASASTRTSPSPRCR